MMTLYGNDADEPIALPNIPNYRTEAVLGRGGMGVVYRAVQVLLNRPVALKMILSGEHASSDERLRFLAEAETIAKLHHPGIVQIYDFGTHGEHPYFAMEYLPDGTLDKKLAGSPLPPNEAAALVKKLAEALQAAHDLGIVHRDLKPANILLTPAGEPKITDFGLAKTGGSNLTATGKVMGTPSYMSPEQAEGKKDVGPATDIYALGAILYECLVGRPPFKAATPLDTILQVLSDEPVSIRQLQAKTPIDLETICHKCLQKEPGKRYGSAKELADDLGRYLRGEPIAARPVSSVERAIKWIKRHRILTISSMSIAAALLVGTGLALWQAQRANEKAEEALSHLDRMSIQEGIRIADGGDPGAALPWFTRPLIQERGLTADRAAPYLQRLGDYLRHSGMRLHLSNAAIEQLPALNELSPDGRWRLIRKDSEVRIVDADTGKLRFKPIKEDRHVWYAAFSPDGKLLVTASSNNTAQVWDATTGLPRTPPLRHERDVYHAAFSPDNKTVVTASYDNTARIWDINNGDPCTPPMQHDGVVIHAEFSADGKSIVTSSHDKTSRIWNAKTGQPRFPPLKHGGPLKCATFSPDCNILVTACNDMTARIWDATTGLPRTPPLRHEREVLHASISPDSRLVITSSGDKTVRVWDALTGQLRSPPLRHEGAVRRATFSPNGRTITTISDDKNYYDDGFRTDITTKDMVVRAWDIGAFQSSSKLLRHNHNVHYAIFSPDGRKIATASDDKTARIWDSISGEALTPPLQHDSSVYRIAFSPDGSAIATACLDKTGRVWDTATGKQRTPVLQHKLEVWSVAFSPDGRFVVTASRDETVQVWDAYTGQPRFEPLKHGKKFASTGYVNHVSISPDSRSIISCSDDWTAQIWDSSTGKPSTPPLKHDSQVRHAVFSPNGRFVATASADKSVKVWDATTGQPVYSPIFHAQSVNVVAFSPDGKSIVTASDDHTARIWDYATGLPLTPPMVHENDVNHVNFSADGRSVVTASSDKTARVWDVATGFPRTPPLQHPGAVMNADFSPDGKSLVTSSYTLHARVWDISHWYVLPIDAIDISTLYSGYSLDRLGGKKTLTSVEYQTLYGRLTKKYPELFGISSSAARHWRENQIRQCLKEGNLPAALFHQNWLLAEAVLEASKQKK
ncbi:MAG: protein kinase [Planctomycetia bacterium]|nr:protein kinase [Planctomycetia bacterium]